ncbi:unnamed protein product [Durusdinium trenchii]|uniref:Uncharacterized protein n=2 Tax=Durusdinium trenchii TaxID=1381693 RepID=A0ABP0LDP3_9DINO
MGLAELWLAGGTLFRPSTLPKVSFQNLEGDYHVSQNGYWDQNGQWIAEAEREAQADAVSEAENTRHEMALEDPASVVEIASKKAGKAIQRAESNAADAQVLHMRLRSQKAADLVGNVKHALTDLMRRRNTLKLKRELSKMDHYWQVLKECDSEKTPDCHQMVRKALQGIAHDATEAAKAAEDLTALGHVVKRRTYPILDLLRMGIGPAPDQLDALDAPNPPDFVPAPGPVPGTAGGCDCAPHSHCAGRGREFPWCKVNRTEPCALLSQPSFVDASGADHRVAGSGQPPAVWDYCAPVSENSETVHAGGHCERRDDIVTKYHDDPDFWSKDGRFNWNQVPRKDRMTLEAMTAPKEGHGLCVRTPSSGAHFVCPTAQDDLDEANPEGTEWARTRTWDFCVPAAPADKIQALQELQHEEEANSPGVQMQAEHFRKPFEKDPAAENKDLALQHEGDHGQNGYGRYGGYAPMQQGLDPISLVFLEASLHSKKQFHRTYETFL